MKIIQANKFYYLKGGAERYMLDLSDWLGKQGHEIIPFAMQHQSNIETQYDRFFPSYVETRKVSLSPSGLRTFLRMLYSRQTKQKMSALISEVQPDLCHIHNIYTQLSPSLLQPIHEHNIPVVMTVHDHHLVSPQYVRPAEGCGDDHQHSGIVRGTAARFHKCSFSASFAQMFAYKFQRAMGMYRRVVKTFITPSKYMKNQLVQGGFDREKIRVIPFGIDAQHIEPVYKNNGYILYVGRLSEEKGVDTLIKAAQMLPDIKFRIVGRGPDEQYLHNLAHGLSNVSFEGFRVGDELKRLYEGAAAVALPSCVHENAPLVLLEAFALGTPAIASDVGGIPEIVEDRINGLLVQPIDLPGWTEAILRIVYDEDLQAELARNARSVVEKRFSLDDHYRQVMNVYQEATNFHL